MCSSDLLVAQVLEDGPAAKGGLRVGDVILRLDNHPIVMSSDLPHRVGVLKPGTVSRLEVMRDGKRRTLNVTIGALPDDEEAAVPRTSGGTERSANRLGVTVTDLTEEQRRSLDLQGGVIIKGVQGGPAVAIGLRPGDVITHLNNQAIKSSQHFAQVARDLPKNRSVSMRVLRQGRASFITFKLAE